MLKKVETTKIRLLCLTAFLTLGFFSVSAAEIPVAPTVAMITLKTEAVSTAEQILMKEVADIAGTSAANVSVLGQLPVGRAASPGQKRMVSQQELLNAIRKSGSTAAYDLKGAQLVSVTAASETLSGQRMADVAIAAVKEYFEKDADYETDIELSSIPADLCFRPGPVELAVELPDTGPRPGSQSIRVRILQAGRRMAEHNVGLRVRITGSVQVAAERMLVGDALAESGIKIIRRELTISELQGCSNALQWVGMHAKRVITAGEALNKSSFALPQIIKRGDAVTIFVRRGGLELATRGEARNDAALHDSVRVLVLDSGSEVVARASGSREVTMDEWIPEAPGRKGGLPTPVTNNGLNGLSATRNQP